MYACDAGPPCTQGAISPCSGHGECLNTTGACACDEGYTGDTSYFSYRDCHNDIGMQTSLSIVTICLACVAGVSAACLLALACTDKRRGSMRGQSAGRQKLLLFIYARMVVASAVSVAYESLVVAAGSAPLRIYEKLSLIHI